MFYIENDQLKIELNTKGAELQSIYSKTTGLSYLWNGDPAFWAKRAPILFPIVGTLKNDRFYYEEKPYHLTRHGFARDMHFSVALQNEHAISFRLESDSQTLAKYPFAFELEVTYTIKENTLRVTYRVYNPSVSPMFFSIGGHPAFRVPLEANTSFEDYFLQFSEPENAGRWPLAGDGILEALPVEFFKNSDRLPLTHQLFENDALVFKHLQSNQVRLCSDKSAHGWQFDFPGFPYLGIWSFKKADFVCIEPWCGIADSVSSDQELIHKEGINMLTPTQEFVREWSMAFF